MKLRTRDLFERVLLTAFVIFLAGRILMAILTGQTHWISSFVLVGELMVLIFVLIGRPAKEVSTSPREWLLAFTTTSMPLFVSPGGEPIAPVGVIVAIFALSVGAQFAAKLNLNRSFGIVPANRGLVTSGLYGFVRHPVYASYLIGHVGFLLANPTFWNFSVYLTALGLQLMRIQAEEGLLSRDPNYVAYRQTVRYRLVPGVY